MPVIAHYIAKCGGCGVYPAPGSSPRRTLEEIAVTALRHTSHDAVAYAVQRGWCAYPLLCPDCAAKAKEGAVTNKIAGLYLNLAKALNALEEAGEDPRGYDGSGVIVEGISGRVTYSPSGHVVEQA
jgi:hypothetical protein